MNKLQKGVCEDLIGLSGPFTKIARIMSAQWSVRIVPSGAECKTDGETIAIPFTADYLPLEKRQELHGMLDHEVCHVAEERRHKENGKETPVKLLQKEKNPVIQMLMNVFEDIRIEILYEGIYKGVAENLRVNNISAAKKWAEEHEERISNDWWSAFGAALILRARDLECEWTEEGDIGEYLDICAEEIEDSKHTSWVDDSIELSKRVFEKVKKHHKKKGKKASGNGKGLFGKGKNGKGDGKGEKVEGDFGPGKFGPGTTDFSEVNKKSMAEYVIHDAKANNRYTPHPKAVKRDYIEVSKPGDIGYYSTAKAEVSSQISGLRGKQRMLIMSWSRRRVVGNLESGFVDDDVLSEVRTGNKRVFCDITKKKYLNTAILALVDCSGSMAGNRYPGSGAYYAFRTAIGLAESWELLGIPHEWLGFSANDSMSTGITEEDLKGPYFCRPPLNHIIFKRFSESLKSTRSKFTGITGRGSNVDGESVSWAARRLAARKEVRKILVVISDGMPSTSNGTACGPGLFCGMADHSRMQEHLRYVVKQITSSGIEVIGIGAGTEGPKYFYNKDTGAKFVYIRELNTMATDIYRVMKQKVTKGMSVCRV
jgi:hypothetical protein